MISPEEKNQIQEIVEEFFGKMTIVVLGVDVVASEFDRPPGKQGVGTSGSTPSAPLAMVAINVILSDPGFLIGASGQTLFDVERALRMMLNKILQKTLYIRVDINDYKKKKIEYLKQLAKDAADEVAFNKEKRALPPMPAYERRIIHDELSQRKDVVSASEGLGHDRHIVISPV